MRQPILGDGRQTQPKARAWTGGDAPTRDSGRADQVSAGDELDAFVTAPHAGSCGTAASVDGASTEGNESNETSGVAAGFIGWIVSRVIPRENGVVGS